MSFNEKLTSIVESYQNLGQKLGDPSSMSRDEFVEASKEYASRADVVAKIDSYFAAQNSLADLEEMAKDSDPEVSQMAQEELSEIRDSLPIIEHEIKILLLPKDKNDDKNVMLEVRAGTGGDEAALFAGDLLGMYQRYADKMGWKFEILSTSDSESGGYKDATAAISGKSVFQRLKFESGVHRVQRVPATETQGRVHTSAATVAVLPEAEDIDVNIVEADLKIDIYRASGPGGQSVNTTDSAVRITHVPTGIVVQNQDQKSQHKNKEKAMRILKTRIYEVQQAQADAERSADRKSQVGSGDRSERIRTYNYPQGRVSDHRINLTLYKIDEIVAGGELGEIIDALTAEDQASKLAEYKS